MYYTDRLCLEIQFQLKDINKITFLLRLIPKDIQIMILDYVFNPQRDPW